MLHAVIRSGKDALHFMGEVNGYNMQSLRTYVRQTARRTDGRVFLSVRIDPADQASFDEHTDRWLPRLRGTEVKVEVRAQ